LPTQKAKARTIAFVRATTKQTLEAFTVIATEYKTDTGVYGAICISHKFGKKTKVQKPTA